MRYVFLLGFIILLTGCSGGSRGETVALSEVPDPVMKVAREQLPDVKFDQAWKTAGGNYEVRGKAKNGKVRDVQVTPTGELVEVD